MSYGLNSLKRVLRGGIHRRADSFVACTCFYIAEDAESSEALEDMVRRTFRPPQYYSLFRVDTRSFDYGSHAFSIPKPAKHGTFPSMEPNVALFH